MQRGVVGLRGQARRGERARGTWDGRRRGARFAGPEGVESVGGSGACATGGRDASARTPRPRRCRWTGPAGGRRRVNRGTGCSNACFAGRAGFVPAAPDLLPSAAGRALTLRRRAGRGVRPRLLHDPPHQRRSVRVEPCAPRQIHHRDPNRPRDPVRLPGAPAPAPLGRPSEARVGRRWAGVETARRRVRIGSGRERCRSHPSDAGSATV